MARSKFIHLRAPMRRTPNALSWSYRYFTACHIDLSAHVDHRYELPKDVALVTCPSCMETGDFVRAMKKKGLVVAGDHVLVRSARAALESRGLSEANVLFVQLRELNIQGTWEEWALFAKEREPEPGTLVVGDGWWMSLGPRIQSCVGDDPRRWTFITPPISLVTQADLAAEERQATSDMDRDLLTLRRRTEICAVSWKDAASAKKKWRKARPEDALILREEEQADAAIMGAVKEKRLGYQLQVRRRRMSEK